MKLQFLLFILVFITLISVFTFFIASGKLVLISPTGVIALYERNLIASLVIIMLICAAPVFLLFAFISIKYRAGQKNAKYEPNWRLSNIGTFLKWALPVTVVFAFAIINWKATHDLDPYKPLGSKSETEIIQVVSLRWKWLFIYPKEKIATVNYLVLPVNTPVEFQLTSDGPMNSFWIPSLSGQIYSMSGMETQTHFMANKPGDFQGSAAEINGKGFSAMNFTVHAASHEDFSRWTETVKKAPSALTEKEFSLLSEPSEENPVTLYSDVGKDLYNKIMMKYMDTGIQKQHSE